MDDYFIGLQNVIPVIVGNEAQTSFWISKWLGDYALKYRFPGLYVECANTNALISKMGTWNDFT